MTLKDIRDGNDYTVAKVNGNVWMTQNLRFTGTTLTPADSNVASNTTLTYYSLDSTETSYADHCDSTIEYNYACIKDSGDTAKGAWYNFAAATAGTITGSSNTNNATYDICPKGWRLPTRAEQQTIANDSSTYVSTWLPVYGGDYFNGAHSYESTIGYWWSSTTSTSYSSTHRYYMYYTSGKLYSGSRQDRRYGVYVRCIKAS